MTETSNNRNACLDICKAIAMFFIILTHVLQRTVPNYTNTHYSSLFLVLGVPIFFFVSGIAASLRKPLSPKAFPYDILKRALTYMWPAVLFLLLRVAFFKQWDDFNKGFSVWMEYPAYGLWVLWLLVWYNLFIDIGLLISYFLPKYKRIIVPITLVIAFAVFIILRQINTIRSYHFLGFDYFMIYTPIFLLGYVVSDSVFKKFNLIVSIVLSVLGLTGAIFISAYGTPYLASGYHIENNLYIYYTAAICAIAFYYGISTLINRVKFGQYIALTGQFTLEGYFLHLMLLKNWGYMNLPNTYTIVILSIVFVLLCYANTILVISATYYLPFTHFLLFGRHFSFYSFENKLFDSIKNFFLDDKKNINNITEEN